MLPRKRRWFSRKTAHYLKVLALLPLPQTMHSSHLKIVSSKCSQRSNLFRLVDCLPIRESASSLRKRIRPISVGSLFVLSGCAIIPSPPVPELDAPDQFLNSNAQSGKSTNATREWISLFELEPLQELLEAAHTRNHNLRAAYQSVQSARAITRQFRSDAWPQIDGSLSANSFSESAAISPDGVSDSGERFDAALSAGWELDLFGRIRKSIRSAEANAAAQEALYYEIMFTLQADVALFYFQANSLQSEIELLEKSRDTRQKSLKLVQERFATGTVSELDVAQSETLLATAEARLFELQRIQNSFVYALGVLVGKTPSTFDFKPKPLNHNLPEIPPGLPGELLTRRPDVKQAEFLLAAASEQVGFAKASFFPQISLSGTIGYAGYNWDELFKPSSYLENLGAQGSLPFFRGGRLRARLAQNRALYEQRLEEFKQVAIEAITEVDDLLQSTHLLERQSDSLTQAVNAAQRAREISSIQYERGLVDFITALDAERTALDIEQQFVQVQRSQFVNTVNLLRALGGSWLPMDSDEEISL